MPYVINDSSGNPIVIPDNQLNKNYSINLVGRNYQNYGREIAEAQVRMLENFANDTPPQRPTNGQLWYDDSNDVLRVYNQDQDAWAPLTPLVVNQEPARDFNQVRQDGIMYFDTDSEELYISVNNDWVPTFRLGDISTAFQNITSLGNPTIYGSRLRTIYLEDTGGIRRAVLALCYSNNGTIAGVSTLDEKIIAIFNGHPNSFTVKQNDVSVTDDINVSYYPELTETGGIGAEIVPGLNLRADNQSRVQYANTSHDANVAFNLNTGNAESYGANITASNVYQKNDDLVANLNDAYTLGTSNTVFAEGYVTDLYIGNGTSGNIMPNGNSVVNIGSANALVNQIFVTDIIVDGNIEVDANTDIGSNTTPIKNVYVEELTANVVNIDGYTMPTDAGSQGHTLYTDGAGNTTWGPVASSIASVTAGAGLQSTTIENLAVGTTPPQTYITISVGAGNGIIANAELISVDMSVFNTDDLVEGSTNLYFSNALARSALTEGDGITYDPNVGELNIDNSYIRELFTGGNGISYNSSTGNISLDYTSPFEGLNPATFVRTTGNQDVGGIKRFTQGIRVDSDIIMGGADFRHIGSLTFTGQSGVVEISSSGDIIADGDITAFSDIRLKENLLQIPDALDKVKELTGYLYTRKDQNNKKQTGLIAQDVKKIMPEVVSENAEGMMSVAYGNLMGLMVEAIKELSAEVEELKKELGKDV